MLKQLARAVEGTLRDSDFFARYGGEEFAVLLPHMDIDGAQMAAERLRLAVEKAGWTMRTVSAGVVALVPQGELSRNTLIARADRALYEAKDAGRNRTARFTGWPKKL